MCKQVNRDNDESKIYRNRKGFTEFNTTAMTSGIKKRLDIICSHIFYALFTSCIYIMGLAVLLSSRLLGCFSWGVSRILSHKFHRSFYLLKIIFWQGILLPCPQGIVCNKRLKITIPDNFVIQSPSSI